MKKIKVVGLGMACLDIVIQAEILPAWEAGTRLSAIAIEGGGPVATALVTVQRLGVSAGFIGTYGSDRLGKIKLQTLIESGMDVSRAIQRNHLENQTVLVAVNEKTGDRVFSGVTVSGIPLSVHEIDRKYIMQAELLHLDGYHIEAALQAAKWMKSAGKPVMLDGSATKGPVSERTVELVQHVDYLICGTGFGPALSGKTDIWEAGRAILSMGPKVVIQTEGKDGSFTTTSQDEFHYPAFDVQVVDTTGAGDVFHGAFIVGIIRNWALRDIISFCTAVSAIKCEQLSGRRGIPTFEETLNFLADRGIYIDGYNNK